MAQKGVLMKFQSPTSICIVAPSYSGKSFLCRRILQNADQMFTHKTKKIYYCYGAPQKEFGEMQKTIRNLVLHEGLPTKIEMDEWFADTSEHQILVFDDLMTAQTSDKMVARIFTVGTHHKNFSIITLNHQIFPKGTYSRLISLNIHYFILFRNRRDELQTLTLAKQIFGNKASNFMEAYYQGTAEPFSYVLIDCHPSSREDKWRVRSKIFPGEVLRVYTPE